MSKAKIKKFKEKNKYLMYNPYFDLQKIDIFEFFRVIFERKNEIPFEKKGKDNYIEGKYNAICVDINKDRSKNWIITSELDELDNLIGSKFAISSPITYVGRNRTSKNARYCYGLAFDIDGVQMKNLVDILHQMNSGWIPTANIIVNSGNGVHLYYLFEEPIALFDNIKPLLKNLKYKLSVEIWNMYTSSIKDKQVQGIFQGFRLPDTLTKFGEVVTAYYNNDSKYHTIESFNQYIRDKKNKISDLDIDIINKATYKHNKLSLAKAKELYPDWYERRIIRGEPRGKWNINRALYDWWLNRIRGNEVKEGHRYFCLMTLSMYAIKCNINYEELSRDAYSLLDPMEELTKSDDNHFTIEDIEDSLKAYKDSYVTFPRKDISNITGIQILPNKRNYRKQESHLVGARFLQNLDDPAGSWRNKYGQPSKKNIVEEYKKNNPNKKKIDCHRDTGLSRSTIDKYW